MSWIITGTEKTPIDPVFNNVSLLLHGDGANGSTTITDSSPTPKTVTPIDNAQISTAVADPFGNSTGVLAFDGTSDSLTIPSSAQFDFDGDCTVEFWVYLNTLDQYKRFLSRGLQGSSPLLDIFIEAAGSITVYFNSGSTTTSTGVLQTSQWHHLALVRNGSSASNISLYVDGISRLQFTNTATCDPAYPLLVSGYSSLDRSINGYISNLRITKGVARYTSNFTPPTAPFPDI